MSPSAMRTTRPVSDAAGRRISLCCDAAGRRISLGCDAAGRRISLGFDAQGDAPSSVRPYDAADALGRAKSAASMRGQVPGADFEMMTFATFLARYGVCQPFYGVVADGKWIRTIKGLSADSVRVINLADGKTY